ncbi:MAG: sulfotransferase domain-containing protein [Opitutales bacterium]|nr:sulfotransferase domain-containing protein [Opitutales bacterium]
MYFKKRLYSTLRSLKIKGNIYCRASVDPHARNDDIWLSSYPKSGNTYLRFLVASALAGKKLDFYDVDHYAPDIYQVRQSFLEKLPSPRIMKSHELARKDYAKVFYVVRNPKSVVLSYAYWANRSKSTSEIEEKMDQIVLDWMERFDGFWDWEEHIAGWFSLIDQPVPYQKIEWIRYEDMIKNPKAVLEKFFNFAEISIDDQAIKEAEKNCSKENMRSSELSIKPFFSSKIRPFVRQGKRPEFEDLVSPRVKRIFLNKYKYWMSRLGYK